MTKIQHTMLVVEVVAGRGGKGDKVGGWVGARGSRA